MVYTYTVVCFGAEIGFGEGETFAYAKREAEDQASDSGSMYPESEWGYIAHYPSGMTIQHKI